MLVSLRGQRVDCYINPSGWREELRVKFFFPNKKQGLNHPP